MSKKLTFTILSISLLTVMAGAAVAPALGIIQQHFSDSPTMLLRFIVSLPALFIILVNLLFTQVTKFLRTKSIALIGLAMYVVCGVGAFLAQDMTTLLVLRALLGVSVGLIMPLSTGLLAYYNPPEEMARLMGLSAAMNQMGGVVATLLAGFLATIDWNYAFLVYAFGLIAVVLVVLYLPNEQLHAGRSYKKEAKILADDDEHRSITDEEAYEMTRREGTWVIIRRFHPSIIGMLLCMGLFFVFVTNFAITESSRFSTMAITYLMVGADVIAFFAGMSFGKVMGALPSLMKFIPPVSFLVAYSLLTFVPGTVTTVIALALLGIANGIGIPYLNTIASIKGGKDSVTTVMPLLSAALYLGQFISPIIVGGLSSMVFGADLIGPYKIAIVFAVIYFIQVIATRHFQKLPPRASH